MTAGAEGPVEVAARLFDAESYKAKFRAEREQRRTALLYVQNVLVTTLKAALHDVKIDWVIEKGGWDKVFDVTDGDFFVHYGYSHSARVYVTIGLGAENLADVWFTVRDCAKGPHHNSQACYEVGAAVAAVLDILLPRETPSA